MAQGREQDEGTSHALVLTTLRQAGAAMTVQQVATAVRLSIATVRFHLGRLEADGLIRSEREQRAHRPGRPRVLYTARPAEAVEAGAAYRQLAGVLAQQLIAVAGTGGALDAGRLWAGRLTFGTPATAGSGLQVDSADPRHPDPQIANPTDRVVRHLDETGFSPRVSGDRRRIELHSCPFMELAQDHADTVCTVHLGLIQGLIAEYGRSVRVRPVLDGSDPCIVELPATEPAGPAPVAPTASAAAPNSAPMMPRSPR